MGEALRILYNQTFLLDPGIFIYQSDDGGLLLIFYTLHVTAFTEMISVLLAGKIIEIQALIAETISYFWECIGSASGHLRNTALIIQGRLGYRWRY